MSDQINVRKSKGKTTTYQFEWNKYGYSCSQYIVLHSTEYKTQPKLCSIFVQQILCSICGIHLVSWCCFVWPLSMLFGHQQVIKTVFYFRLWYLLFSLLPVSVWVSCVNENRTISLVVRYNLAPILCRKSVGGYFQFLFSEFLNICVVWRCDVHSTHINQIKENNWCGLLYTTINNNQIWMFNVRGVYVPFIASEKKKNKKKPRTIRMNVDAFYQCIKYMLCWIHLFFIIILFNKSGWIIKYAYVIKWFVPHEYALRADIQLINRFCMPQRV